MITAGLLNSAVFDVGGEVKSLNDLANVSTVPGIGAVGSFNWDTLGQNVAGMVGRSIVTAGVSSAITGADFKDGLRNNLVSDFAAVGANAIGTKWGGGSTDKNPYLQTVAHGVLGCAAAAAKGGDCKSGAVGGMTESVMGNVIDKFGGLSNTGNGYSQLTRGLYTGAAVIAADVVSDQFNLKASDAMGAAQNSASNNYLSHAENKDRLTAASACAGGDAEACETEKSLNALDIKRDVDFHAACDGQSSSAGCRESTSTMRDYLATYADPKLKTDIATHQVSSDQLSADRDELQSYVPLMSVGNKTVFNNDAPSRIPTLYNADPYSVVQSGQNGLYVTAKFGNEWMAVGSTSKVFTDYGGLNGIQNAANYAPGLAGYHVNSVNADTGLYTLYYTPDHAFLKDGFLTFADKLGFTTNDAKNFSKVLEGVQAGSQDVTWVAHSRGGVIFTEGARVANVDDLSKNWVVFHAGANNRWVSSYILPDKKISLGDAWQRDDKKDVPPYLDSPYDAVPNIIGLNGNPLDMLKSLLATPLLFAGPEWSPHTLPYKHEATAAAPKEETPPSPTPHVDFPLPPFLTSLEVTP